MTTPQAQQVLKQLADNRTDALKRLHELLSIPSVSTDPQFTDEVQQTAQWLAGRLEESGLNVDIHATPGHPIVLARTPADSVPADAPRVLFYGHYDVQPPDPLDQWTTPPFEPTVRNDAIVARGASDDKGQVSCFLEAVRAWHTASGKFPVHITVLIEGEEECGSPNLPQFLEDHRDELHADIVLISDTAMWNEQTPAIIYGLRGLLYYDLKLTNPNRDLHSGTFGGVLANPATMLTRVLGKLFDDQHRITIPGFYDDVPAITDEEKQQWSQLNFDEMRDCLAPVGVQTPFGEAGFTTLERKWARPACDINGLYGGYGGEGAKTVIPATAGAKVSFRIVPGQDPQKIDAAFRKWIQSHDVHGCQWKITTHGMSEAPLLSTDSPFIDAARRALLQTANREPVLVREGASIPVVLYFKQMLGLDAMMLGFGLPDDRLHSPNEKFDLRSFDLGCQTHAVLLEELGGMRV